MDGEKKLRVYNKCKYDIGVTLMSGLQPNIKAGTAFSLSVNDIIYIDSTAQNRKPFSCRDLVAVDDNGKELTLEQIGGFTDPYAEEHASDEQIQTMLKKSAKQIEAWLEKISDPVELHAIAEVAESMDLPQSKLKVISAKVPTKDFMAPEE